MAVVSPTIIPVGAEEVIGTNRTSTVLVGRTTLNGRPPVKSTAADDVAAASGVLEGRMIKGSPPVELIDGFDTATEVGKTIDDGTRLVEPTDTAGRPPVELSPASTVDVGRTIDGTRSVEPTDIAGRPPVELSPASAVDVGRTIDDGRRLVEPTDTAGRPPVELSPASTVDFGRTIDDGRRSVEPTDTAGRPPVELSPASTVDVGRTMDDGRPPVEPAPVSAVEIGKVALGRSMT